MCTCWVRLGKVLNCSAWVSKVFWISWFANMTLSTSAASRSRAVELALMSLACATSSFSWMAEDGGAFGHTIIPTTVEKYLP